MRKVCTRSRASALTVDKLIRSFSGDRDIQHLRGIYYVLDIHALLIYETKQTSFMDIPILFMDIP